MALFTGTFKMKNTIKIPSMPDYIIHKIIIVEMQSDNNPYGDPDNGCPEEALNDYLYFYPKGGEQLITKGEHNFIIWQNEEPNIYYANAWSFAEGEDGIKTKDQEFTTYYEMKVLND
jgi:hypothetical protein